MHISLSLSHSSLLPPPTLFSLSLSLSLSLSSESLSSLNTPSLLYMASPAATKKFLGSLRLSSFDSLLSAKREACRKCGASRKIFCYDCYEPVGLPEDALPHVQLPIRVDIVKHPLELQSKSTAVHARILSPSSVRIFMYPEIPEINDSSKTLLAFPASDALPVSEVDPAKFDSIIFVDSTWFQAKGIVLVRMGKDCNLSHKCLGI